MEDKDNNQLEIEKLMLRKRKLIELREEIKVKSSFKAIKVNEEDECSPFSIEQPSISPPPFSPLTPLTLRPKQNKLQCEPTSDTPRTVSPPLASSSSLKNGVNNVEPTSSPIPAMSPETQILFNALTEVDLESENLSDTIKTSDISVNGRKSYYDAASDDSVEDPDFTVDNMKQRVVDESETDCDSTNELELTTSYY